MYVDIQNLTKKFDSLTAVDQLNFAFDSSHIHGFVGPNGSGKTTTMRIMATLDTPTTGEARIGGYSSISQPEKVREIIGFMPDYYNAYPQMTVWEYMDFFSRCYGFRYKERIKKVESVMAFTDLVQLKDKLIDTLSKGMKQRLCLGRALIHDPKVLILDEPAAGLDPRARIELRELLKILKEEGRAILISSHILTELAEICDGVTIIEKGCLIASGNISDIQNQLNKRVDTKQILDIKVVAKMEECEKFLLEQVETVDVKETGSHLRVTLDGGEKDQVTLLQKLVQHEFPVAEYRIFHESLEDIFMKLTKGEIQ